MSHRNNLVTLLAFTLLALNACSSSFGDGTPPPTKVNVVVPPNSTTTTNGSYTTTSP